MSQDRFFNSLSADFGDSGAGFTKEELLGYVEGELPPDRADALALRLLTDPALFRQLEQMRINRSVLMSMPLEKAPADLLSRVQIAFEQEALVGAPLEEELGADLKLVSDGPALGGMRRMDIREYRTPWYQSRLAMAAGVLLLISGGIYWGMNAFYGNPPAPRPLAKAEHTNTVPPAPDEPLPSVSSEPDATEPKLAINDNPVLDLVDSARPTQADLADAISLPDRIISPDQAAALARDGRLAIRVATLRSDQAAAQVDKLTAVKPEASRSWRVGRDISDEVIATVASATSDPSDIPLNTAAARSKESGAGHIAASASLHDVARVAQSFAPIQMPLSPPSMNMPAARVARKPVGFVVEVDGASNSLAAIKGLLAEKTDCVATFIELPKAVDSGAVTDAAAIMWFTQSPENWVPRVRVPVVVGR